MTKDAVVAFDLGGVLVDIDFDQPKRLLSHRQHQIEDAFFAKAQFNELVIGQITETTFLTQVADELHVSTAMARRAFVTLCKPKPFVNSMLHRLTVPFVIWSNINSLHYHHLRNKIPAIRSNEPFFALSFQLGIKKPDRLFFEVAKSKIHGNVWFFDDRNDNIFEAARHGIKAEKVDTTLSLLKRLDNLGFLQDKRNFELI